MGNAETLTGWLSAVGDAAMTGCGREMGRCSTSDFVCEVLDCICEGDEETNHSLGRGMLFDLDLAA